MYPNPIDIRLHFAMGIRPADVTQLIKLAAHVLPANMPELDYQYIQGFVDASPDKADQIYMSGAHRTRPDMYIQYIAESLVGTGLETQFSVALVEVANEIVARNLSCDSMLTAGHEGTMRRIGQQIYNVVGSRVLLNTSRYVHEFYLKLACTMIDSIVSGLQRSRGTASGDKRRLNTYSMPLPAGGVLIVTHTCKMD
jgi:hypothetical protein